MLYSCALPSVSFCAVHPNQPKILGFVAKHPASDMFHCYIFQSKKFVSNRRLKCITALRLLEDDTTIAKPLYSSKSQNLHLYCPVTDDQQYRWHITPPNPITTVMASQSILVIIMEVNGAETAPTYTKRSQSEQSDDEFLNIFKAFSLTMHQNQIQQQKSSRLLKHRDSWGQMKTQGTRVNCR